MKIGLGVDVHQLVKGRKLILGGVEVPYEKGLLGHSDADVLTHAIADSLLGAAGLGDIGHFFPDTDPKFKNADSLVLLREVAEKIKSAGYSIGNIDAVVQIEEPKLAHMLPMMKEKLAAVLKIKLDKINLKVKRGEKIGYVGEGKGVLAQAVALLDH